MKSLEERLKDRAERRREAERQRDELAGILTPQKPEDEQASSRKGGRKSGNADD